jgi:hypothetical protein
MTPAMAQDGVEKMKECMAQICIKIHAGAEDIQETVLGLMNHCLTILHKQDKRVCFVNAAKSLEAKKLTEFPQDFTDFHDDWGKWDEPMKSFLNTMSKAKDRSFTGSFYFRSLWDPDKLFEKTLLKMAGPIKLKGSICIGVKPCQFLDTKRAVIFFNLPFCSAPGLRQALQKAMTIRNCFLSRNILANGPGWSGAAPCQNLRWSGILYKICHGGIRRRRIPSRLTISWLRMNMVMGYKSNGCGQECHLTWSSPPLFMVS